MRRIETRASGLRRASQRTERRTKMRDSPRRRELDLAIYPSRTQQSRVENIDSVRRHDNLRERSVSKSTAHQSRQERTLMFFVASNPSSWLSSSSMVLCTSESPPPLPLSPRDDPIESISSMKMIDGACSLAMTNSSRTCAPIVSPSPHSRPRDSLPSSSPLQCTSAPTRFR